MVWELNPCSLKLVSDDGRLAVEIVPSRGAYMLRIPGDGEEVGPIAAFGQAKRTALALAHELNVSMRQFGSRSREDFESTEREIRELWAALVSSEAVDEVGELRAVVR